MNSPWNYVVNVGFKQSIENMNKSSWDQTKPAIRAKLHWEIYT